jgi:sugar phosphate isomerase/epimerase
MFHNLCPDTIGISGIAPAQLIQLAAKYGFGGIDFPIRVVKSISEAKELRGQLDHAGLRWGQFWLPFDFLSADESNYQEGLTKLREILPIVRAAGCTRCYNHIWPGSDTRDFKENFNWHLNRAKAVSGILGEYGVQYGLEFLGPKHLRDKKYPFIYRLEQVLELADAAGANVGIVVDSFHLYCSGGTAADVRKLLTGNRIVNVHLNDGKAGRGPDEQLDLERELPMAIGVIDTPGLVRVLREIGYDGPMIVEPFQPQLNRLRKMPAEEVLQEISGIMKRLLAASGA